MIRTISCVAVLAWSATALAQERPTPATGEKPRPMGEETPTPTAAAPDFTKYGPLTRPVKHPDKKGVDTLFKTMMDACKGGDVEAAAENIDFPVIMLSDDSTGAAKTFMATREQWIEIMRPFITNAPKDMKMSHKHEVTFLSDTLAVAIEDNGMEMGKVKGKWKSMSVVTLKDGRWKFKQMAEAGWGDMPMPGKASASGPSRTPTNTVPPQ